MQPLQVGLAFGLDREQRGIGRIGRAPGAPAIARSEAREQRPRRGAPGPAAGPGGRRLARVTVDNSLSDSHTVIEVKAPDRVGLLYQITQQSPQAAHLLNPSLALAVSVVLQRALSKHAIGRYRTCGAFVSELTSALAQAPHCEILVARR